jgi:hypothetical protein
MIEREITEVPEDYQPIDRAQFKLEFRRGINILKAHYLNAQMTMSDIQLRANTLVDLWEMAAMGEEDSDIRVRYLASEENNALLVLWERKNMLGFVPTEPVFAAEAEYPIIDDLDELLSKTLENEQELMELLVEKDGLNPEEAKIAIEQAIEDLEKEIEEERK